MVIERTARRMTFRQLLTHSEKYSRDLIEHFQATVLPRLADFRDLSRPTRRRSNYPTLMALYNALNKVERTSAETRELTEYLQQRLKEIREHAHRERSRKG